MDLGLAALLASSAIMEHQFDADVTLDIDT